MSGQEERWGVPGSPWALRVVGQELAVPVLGTSAKEPSEHRSALPELITAYFQSLRIASLFETLISTVFFSLHFNILKEKVILTRIPPPHPPRRGSLVPALSEGQGGGTLYRDVEIFYRCH